MWVVKGKRSGDEDDIEKLTSKRERVIAVHSWPTISG